jgi:hypothetical protein
VPATPHRTDTSLVRDWFVYWLPGSVGLLLRSQALSRASHKGQRPSLQGDVRRGSRPTGARQLLTRNTSQTQHSWNWQNPLLGLSCSRELRRLQTDVGSIHIGRPEESAAGRQRESR